MNEPIEVDLKDIFAEIDRHLLRISWNKEKAIEHLSLTYFKTSRLKLTDEELLEFLDFLRMAEPAKLIGFKPLKLRRLPPLNKPSSQNSNIEPLF